jgi:2-phospho-L-lactate/phosphoenolpyruvate guanylyltransferase
VNGRLPVLVPMNSLERAKGRLADLLAPEERRQLARITLETVLHAATEAGLEPIVVTADPAIAGLVAPVRVLTEEIPAPGLNAELEAALRRLASEGHRDVLILHADLPLADAASLRRLLARALPPPSVTVVRSEDGGTNAMLLRPPGRFPLAYGKGSFAAHRRAARASGTALKVVQSAALTLDIDTPADITRLLATPRGRTSPAGKYLNSLSLEARLQTT